MGAFCLAVRFPAAELPRGGLLRSPRLKHPPHLPRFPAVVGAVLGFSFVYGGAGAVVWLEPSNQFPYMKGVVRRRGGAPGGQLCGGQRQRRASVAQCGKAARRRRISCARSSVLLALLPTPS
jgi:hypothetical protein